MEGNLNYQELENYSKGYAKKVCDEFFSDHKKINGEQILTLTKIKQINLLVIRNLFSKWKEEVQNLESPYFDYGNKAVRKGLREFMNVLSRHINIDREHFTPLLEKAVYDTLWLLLSPYDYYCSLINPPSVSRLRTKELTAYLRYIKINKALFESYVNRLAKLGDEVFVDDANRVLNEVFADTEYSPDDIDQFKEELNMTLSFEASRFYPQGVSRVKVPKGESPGTDIKETITLNDTLKREDNETTIADAHAKRKIASLKDTLTINQKFMFINQLFDGNVEDFNKIVDFIDQSTTYQEASDFLYNNYIKKNSWKKDSNEVVEFMSIIEKRFIPEE